MPEIYGDHTSMTWYIVWRVTKVLVNIPVNLKITNRNIWHNFNANKTQGRNDKTSIETRMGKEVFTMFGIVLTINNKFRYQINDH